MVNTPTAIQIGKVAEDLACDYLQQQGLQLITRNYYCRMGEIDLIMQDQSCLAFIEVRYRRNTIYGSSSESVTPSKQHKLLRTASYYLQQHHLTESIATRFDVIAITANNPQPTIEWIKNAFTS